MRPRIRRLALLGASAAMLVATLGLAPAAYAHGHVHVGDFELTIGWSNEPTFVGQPNAVELSIADHDGAPVADLGAEALGVVVTAAGQDSERLPLSPAFGAPGVYVAELIPTTPGEYTFHFTGSIGDEPVDVTMTSGDDAFSEARNASDIEFPVKLPNLGEVATRLDRIDGRIEELQQSAIDPQQLADLQASINAARNAADGAATSGMLLGGAGLLVAVVALVVALRASRRGSGTA